MPISKKSTSRAKNPAIENLAGITISVFFLSILIITTVFVVMFVVFGQPDDKKSAWRDLIIANIERYPAMQPVDVYKLVYQGTFGPAHLAADSLLMLNYLQDEIAGIDADSNTASFEPVCPSRKYIRINLKYFKAIDGDPHKLVSAILRSSVTTTDSNSIKKHWKWVEEMAEDGELPFEPVAFQAFSDSIKNLHYPVIHHSEEFMKIYKPAYRVINREFEDFLPHILDI